jgi:Family of unknown function (DUF5681)
MGILTNPRHEFFARELAKGKSANEAYKLAGYRPCRQNAHRLSSNDDIKQRIAELRTQRDIDIKNDRDVETGRFIQGNSGNPLGRPRGSRNKLGEAFLMDLHDEWLRSGASALKRVAKDDPVQFVKVVASILPREIDTTLTVDTELFQEVRDFREAWRLARSFIGADDDNVDDKLIELQPVEEVTDG